MKKYISPKLLIVLAVLAVAALLVLQRPGERNVSSHGVLVEYDSSAINAVEIVSSHGAFTIEKQGGIWMVTSPLRYKADQQAVQTAVGKGSSLSITSPISSNPEKQGLFQVDSAGTLVTMSASGTEKARVRIGKVGSSFANTYVRVDESSDVYLVDGVLPSVFSKPLRDWRDKTIFQRERSAIGTVRFTYPKESFVLNTRDSIWTVDLEPVFESRVTPFMSAISNLQTDDFIDDEPSSLPAPSVVIQVDEVTITLYSIDGDAKYYARSSMSPQLFGLNKWKAEQLLKHKSDFLEEKK